jgi:hypothetical protein
MGGDLSCKYRFYVQYVGYNLNASWCHHFVHNLYKCIQCIIIQNFIFLACSNGSTVITLKAKWKFSQGCQLFCYILQKITVTKVPYFCNYHTSFQDPTSSGASVNPTSQVCASAMSFWLREMKTMRFGDAFKWHNIHTICISWKSVTKFKRLNGEIYKQHSDLQRTLLSFMKESMLNMKFMFLCISVHILHRTSEYITQEKYLFNCTLYNNFICSQGHQNGTF